MGYQVLDSSKSLVKKKKQIGGVMQYSKMRPKVGDMWPGVGFSFVGIPRFIRWPSQRFDYFMRFSDVT